MNFNKSKGEIVESKKLKNQTHVNFIFFIFLNIKSTKKIKKGI